jgi:nucleotide-binding universal stress UspA family protein
VKILVAVDDSSFAKAAVEFVARSHWAPGTEVILLAVARSPFLLSTEVYAPSLSYNDDLMKQELEAHRKVAENAEAELKQAGFRTGTMVVTGDPRIEIVEEATRSGVDLVVVGSHGRTGFQRLLLGSVAAYVTTNAPCSVLIVKSPELRDRQSA